MTKPKPGPTQEEIYEALTAREHRGYFCNDESDLLAAAYRAEKQARERAEKERDENWKEIQRAKSLANEYRDERDEALARIAKEAEASAQILEAVSEWDISADQAEHLRMGAAAIREAVRKGLPSAPERDDSLAKLAAQSAELEKMHGMIVNVLGVENKKWPTYIRLAFTELRQALAAFDAKWGKK